MLNNINMGKLTGVGHPTPVKYEAIVGNGAKARI
jgi:hypothetical protein